ncbi:metal ABC transporter substrate-binding protein [Streptomyces sp. WAC 00631]|uniref:metal ABC transporter substrate-binding protein n=1 Tax=unclassified Streptomyces TaxID=2593676 RepID=UPI000F788577|nr:MULTISPECIES: metal ABC transporter substrate-binding protein [unclassified Streptomyces]MCC5034960.1 metal ABC transporter substrate-binding protein [Streptomyces sp. WAC 00631]MCC9741690.1 metal ABC transporter substrate-binding protein [Streptomyces sp. MNU89]
MNVRRNRPASRITIAAAAAGATALGLVTLTACGTGTADAGGDGTVDVVASFYPLEFVAEEVGGEHVSVTTLTKPGVEPHDLEIKPRQTAELSEADVAFYLKGLQPAVDAAVAQSGVKKAVDAAELGAGEHGEEHTGEQPDEHGEEHGGEHTGEHSGEPESGGDGHDHSGGASDPHLWLDPTQYAEVAEGFAKTLAEADPDHAAAYEKNAEALVKKLEALDKDFADGLRNRTTDTFITTHAAFGHLASRYGLEQEAIGGLDPEAEPSPARMRELHTIAEREKVTTVFFETLVSDATAKTLAADTGLKTDVLDPLEGITDRSAGDDYFEVMRANLDALRKALGSG